MVFLKRFLCLSTRQGCILMSVCMCANSITAISMFMLFCVNMGLFEPDFEPGYFKNVAFSTFAAYGFICLASLALVFGATSNKRWLILPWLLFIIPVAIVDGFSMSFFTYESYQSQQEILEFVNTNIVLSVIRFTFWVLGFLTASSHYNDLSTRGRDALTQYRSACVLGQKPHQEQSCEIQLHPPPYIENPPSYKDIFYFCSSVDMMDADDDRNSEESCKIETNTN